MSLLQALLFPLRNPIRYAFVVGIHCLAWSMVVGGLEYLVLSAGSLDATSVLVQCIAAPIMYAIWLQRRAIATLRRVIAGRRSLPPLKISDFLPLRLRTVFSTLFIFSFVAIFVLVIQGLRFDMWAHIVAFDATYAFEAVHLLARFAIICVALTLLTVIYIVGLARYATEGDGRQAGQLIADKLLLFNESRIGLQYLLLQLLLLSGAVYLLELGIALAISIRLPGLGYATDAGMAWRTFSMFVFASGFVLVWNASLHLLAQYARAIGINSDDMGKAKREFTRESAGGWLICGRRARP